MDNGRPSATCPTSLRSPEPVPVSAHSGDGQAQKPKPYLGDVSTLIRRLRSAGAGPSNEAADALEWTEWQRQYAISWANRSVDSVKARMWAVEDGLRNLVALLADTGFHNSIEMAAARKLLRGEDRDDDPYS